MTQPGKIFGLIPKIADEIGPIAKARRNEGQNYQFRGIEDFLNNVHPALIKHGVFFAPEVIESQTSEGETRSGATTLRVILRVRFRFYADDGSFVEVITQGEGIDSSDKASNKAMSAATKYCLINIFCIPTADIADPEKDNPEAGRSRFQINNVAAAKKGLF